MASEEAEEGEGHVGEEGQEDAVQGGGVGLLEIFLSQTPGKVGVDADGGAASQGDHQALDGKGHGNGREGMLGNPSDEHAVHHVVHGLDQHGNHDGKGHAD